MATPMTATPAESTGLAKAYDPRLVEAGLYDRWDAAGYFQPRRRADREPFVIIMPPPNVTGELHIGHALFVTVEDIMIRWHRMLGDPTLWLPGADHAGIAGQWVVEKAAGQEGLTRHDLGREKFVERVWEFMNQYRGRIREQMRILGASCDWTRFAFTMDPGPSRAVRTRLQAPLRQGADLSRRAADLLVPALPDRALRPGSGPPRRARVPLALSPTRSRVSRARSIIVATTRPETMLGDTGVAVHPDDERYRHLIGKSVRLPIVGRLIPIVADDAVDPGVRHRRGEGDARPRSERLRDRPAARPADRQRDEPRRHDERRGRAVRGHDASRAGAERRRRAAEARPARWSRPSHTPRGRPLRPLRHGRRADDRDAVVREHGATGRARDRGRHGMAA